MTVLVIFNLLNDGVTMIRLNKWVASLALASMVCMSCHDEAAAREYCTDAGGCAYEEAYQSCYIAPAVALALVAIAAIIAVGVHNRSHSDHDHVSDSD